MEKKKSVIYLGFSGFPYGLAEVQKLILISKSLIFKGNYVTVICRNGTFSESEGQKLKVKGTYENIDYIYASGSCVRNKYFLKRRFLEAKGKVNEWLLIRKRRKENNLDFAILSTRSFSSIVFYCFLSKLYCFKIILNYVEFYSGIRKSRLQIGKRLNDYLFDRFAPVFCDGVFPISEFLINQVKRYSPKKRYLKIPVLTDFDRYNGIKKDMNKKYFLFCGAAAYKEIVKFIIDSFELLNTSSYFLYLIINGKEGDMREIGEYIQKKEAKQKIRILSNLTEKDLFRSYYDATALLIPLRPSQQDLARFPHKVGEYVASGNPVISTDHGEIHHYFKDMENMLLADKYNIESFAEKMQFVIKNPTESKEIGLRGKEIAYENFEYRNFSGVLDTFLNEL